jgi:hypothetical protein
MKHFLFFVLICLCSILQGGTIDPNRSDAEYIKYGEQHACVLPIMGFYNDKVSTPFRGSCVLIDNNIFLTAAHIVKNSMLEFVVWDDKAYLCDKIIIHENFVPEKLGFNDIAIGLLLKPIYLDFYPALYTDADEVGKISSQSGFGFTGNFNNGYIRNNFDNKRRAGSNIVENIEKNLLICSLTDKPHTALEILIAPGDSGGGLFINQKLAGIHSCVYAKDGKTDSSYGDTSGHTRISDYVKWIDSQKTKLVKSNE